MKCTAERCRGDNAGSSTRTPTDRQPRERRIVCHKVLELRELGDLTGLNRGDVPIFDCGCEKSFGSRGTIKL